MFNPAPFVAVIGGRRKPHTYWPKLSNALKREEIQAAVVAAFKAHGFLYCTVYVEPSFDRGNIAEITVLQGDFFCSFTMTIDEYGDKKRNFGAMWKTIQHAIKWCEKEGYLVAVR